MPPLWCVAPPGDTGRQHETSAAHLVGERINDYSLAGVAPQLAPGPVDPSRFTQRPARNQTVTHFSPKGNCGAWCRDSFRGQRMRHEAKLATPRGGLQPDRQRVNIRRPASTSFGQLVERMTFPYGY